MQDETVDIDGTIYKVANLSPEIQNRLKLYKKWQEELESEEEKCLKIKMAMKTLSNDLILSIRT